MVRAASNAGCHILAMFRRMGQDESRPRVATKNLLSVTLSWHGTSISSFSTSSNADFDRIPTAECSFEEPEKLLGVFEQEFADYDPTICKDYQVVKFLKT